MISVPEFQPYQRQHACPLCEDSYAGRCGFAFIKYVATYEPKHAA